MKTLFVSIMLLSAFNINGQSTKSSVKNPEKFTDLKLEKYPIADFPENSVPVSDIRIIQVLNDSVRMGYTFKGDNSYVTTLRVKKPLTGFLQELIYRMYKDDFKKTGIKMLWILKDFRLTEKGTQDAFYGYTKLQADAYISKEGVLYSKALTIDTVILRSGVFDFVRLYSSDFESIFRILAKRTLLAADSLFNESSASTTVNQIVESAKATEIPPVLTDSFFVDGIYTDFIQFLQNKPAIVKYGLVSASKSSLKFIDSTSNKEIDSAKIWGFCKQGKIYKYSDGSLIEIERLGSGFIISDFIETINKYNAKIAAYKRSRQATLIYFPPAPILIINPFILFSRKHRYGEPLLVEQVPGIDEKSMLPLAFGINMKTGEFSF